MNSKQVTALLEKYSNGTCTPEEVAIIHKWYNQYQFDEDVLASVPAKRRELIKSRMLHAILQDINEEKALSRAPIYARMWFQMAAAAILLIILSVGFFQFFANAPATEQIKIVNNSDNIIKQILPDQSVVWLNPKASISYPKAFKSVSRDVEMLGECFFEVTRNPDRPFIIHSQRLLTKVWGTKFRVLDRGGASAAEVAVMSGKVSVSVQGSEAAREVVELVPGEVVLTPNQKVRLAAKSQNLHTYRNADVSEMTIYQHETLLFDDATLEEIAGVLSKTFKAEILIRDKAIGKKVLNADLTDLNLPEVLEVLKTSLRINYEMRGRQINLISQ